MTNKTIKTAIALLSATILCQAQTETNKKRDEITAMSNIGACRGGSYLENGKEIIFGSNMSGSPQIWKVPAQGGWPVQLTAFSDPVVGYAAAPKGDLIAFELAPGGGLNTQIYLMKSDGTDVKQITQGGKIGNELNAWSDDGTLLSFTSNEQNDTGVDFFIYDVKKGTYELTVKNKGVGSIDDFSADKQKVLITRLVSRGNMNLYLYDLKTKQEKLLTAHEGPGTFFGLIAPSGEVYLGSNKNRDLISFGKVAGEDISILSEEKNAELSNVEVDHRGTNAVLLWNASGRNKVTLFDIKAGKVTKELKFPVELVSGISYSPDDKSIVFTGTGSTEPANVWTYTFASGEFKKITDSPHAGVDLTKLIAPELVTFTSFDGLEMSGWLYKPKNATPPYRTVISYHGGPEGQSIPNFSPLAQALVKEGIAYFMPNVRGSSGFGKKFVNLDNGELRFDGVKDIKGVSDFLVSKGIAKKDALGIIGGSYGGYMVMAGVTEYPDMFAAGANLFGIVNFETFFKHTEPWMAAISTIEYGDPATQADLLKKLSPFYKSDVIKTPLLVEHGANDTNVPVIEAEQVVAALKKNNIPVQYTLFPDEGHGWLKTKNRITSNVEIAEWFADRLK
jgi:dipeptidyl aminopeptidase/acylaminoacyl peptidase